MTPTMLRIALRWIAAGHRPTLALRQSHSLIAETADTAPLPGACVLFIDWSTALSPDSPDSPDSPAS